MKKKLSYLLTKIFIDKKRNHEIIGNKVLVNDCQKIGNYLFKTPLIKGLALEGYEVYILGSKLTKELGDNNPYIKKVIIDNCYRKKSFDIFRNIKTGIKYRNFFDFYIENVGSTYLREALLMRILNAKKNIGIERKNNKILKLLDIIIKKAAHMREDGIEILKYFKIQSPKCIYDIHLSKNKYENMIKKKPLILYNGLASTKSRSIDKNKENRILEGLKAINWVDVQQIKKENSIIDLCGLIKKADLVITVDTGVAHIASAFNIPIIIHETNERVYPKSDIVIEESFYKKELPKTVEDILKYVYTISA